MNIGRCHVELVDDGTLDTVISVAYRIRPEQNQEVRFSSEFVGEFFRDENGDLTEEGFRELGRLAVEVFEE